MAGELTAFHKICQLLPAGIRAFQQAFPLKGAVRLSLCEGAHACTTTGGETFDKGWEACDGFMPDWVAISVKMVKSSTPDLAIAFTLASIRPAI